MRESGDFPDKGTHPPGEPDEASLLIDFRNTASVAAEYTIQATFIETTPSRELDAGTATGSLEPGEEVSYVFNYEGSPETIVDIDDYELDVSSTC